MDLKIEHKLEEVRDLLTEAKYLIEEVDEKSNVFQSMKTEYLEPVTEIIAILSKIKDGWLKELPIETVYKFLYLDYKKGQNEIKELRKDIEALMQKNNIDEDKQVLILKLQRAEREIETLMRKNESRKEKLRRLKDKYFSKIKELKAKLGETDSQEEDIMEENEDCEEEF